MANRQIASILAHPVSPVNLGGIDVIAGPDALDPHQHMVDSLVTPEGVR